MINNRVVKSYKICPVLSYKLFVGEKGQISEYEQFLEEEKNQAKIDFISNLKKNEIYDSKEFTSSKVRNGFYSNLIFNSNQGIASIELLEKSKKEITPYLFKAYDKVSSHDRLEFEWIKLACEKKGYKVTRGKIVSLNATKSVRISSISKLKEILHPINEFEKSQPRIIQNKHCRICEFNHICSTKLKESDDLSLLSIGKKQISKLEKKGIFTLQQLSYTYKPRKKSKKYRENHVHKPELQALALRSKKVFVQKIPEIPHSPVELYFDIEGITELDDYYLFGILVSSSAGEKYEHFYSKSTDNTAQIWKWFLQTVTKYQDAKIYHYGSYEAKVLEKLSKKYQTDISQLKTRLVNINSFIYGKIYFPTYSNSLKHICKYIDFEWSISDADGIKSIIWRKKWLRHGKEEFIKSALKYNEDDCVALKKLKQYLINIKDTKNLDNEIDFLKSPVNRSSEESKFTQEQFKLVLKSSYHHYENVKISFAKSAKIKSKASQINTKKGYKGQRKKRPIPTKRILVERDKTCHFHPDNLLIPKQKQATRLIIDLKLTSRGIRKEIVEYVGCYSYCKKCQRMYSPRRIREIPRSALYGHGMRAYIIYNRICLRTPYEKIAALVNEQFNETICDTHLSEYTSYLADYYHFTENRIVENLISGDIIHADETTINVRGETQYIWVFTDGKNFCFRWSKTREADLPKEFLKNFKGVLITDFYTGYDSIDCLQQKCWVHLLRDINQDLRKNPFDNELESFVIALRKLFIPIMETVQRFGLKHRYLKKYKKEVTKFYKDNIDNKHYSSEFVQKYQKRFAKYRKELFEFLNDDNISWHNNQAERGLRHLVKQKAISSTFHQRLIPSYLVLLGIMQTCRFTGKSFFQFLFSKETDLEAFKIKKK